MNNQYYNFLKIVNTALTGKLAELDKPDFEFLINLSFEQDLAPIFLEGALKYSEFSSAPIAAKARLISSSTKAVVRQTQHTAEFYSIYQKLCSAGLKPIVLKGLVCRKAYGKFENHRVSGDEDIYVPKEDFPLCLKILTENGYATDEKISFSEKYLSRIHTAAFKNQASKLVIEVHLSAFGTQNPLRVSMNRRFEEAFKTPCKIVCDSNEIYTLDPTSHYLFLFLHYLKHFMTMGAGVRHLTDMALFGDKYKESINFSAFEKDVTDFIDGSFYADSEELMHLLGGFQQTSFKTKNSSALLEDLMNGGTFGYKDREITYASTYLFSKTSGSRFALLRAVFPSYGVMSSMYPELYDKPWRLPSLYCKRITNYIGNKRDSEKEKESIKKSDERFKLIKQYKLRKK